MNCNHIGIQIRKLRKSKNLTQEQLGNEIGVSMQAVSKWECGGLPDIIMLVKLANYFDVTTDSLLGLASDKEGVLEEALYSDITRTHIDHKIEKVCRYCWTMCKALSGMPAVKNDNYCNVDADEMVCSQARILLEDGIVNMSVIEDFHYFLIVPEPKEGYGIALSDIEKYTRFFKLLAKPNRLKMLSYIHSIKTTLFSAERAATDIKISTAEAETILNEFHEKSWVFKDSATLSDRAINLYRPNHTTSFIPLLRFATEMIEMPSLWFISNYKRDKPLLKYKLKDSSNKNRR